MADQQGYVFPDDMLLPLSISINGVPWARSDMVAVEEIAGGWRAYDTVWWVSTINEFGDSEVLRLWPTPSTSGLSITLEYVYRPVELVADGDSPDWLPVEFHPYLLNRAAAEVYATVEDNPDFAEYHSQKFDQGVLELKRYRRKRSSSGPFRIQIVY